MPSGTVTPAGGGGGSSAAIYALLQIYNTGPNGGLDTFIPLTPLDAALSGLVSGDYCVPAQTSFGVPVTLGAGGGFAPELYVPKAFALANPTMKFFMEIDVSNAAGTQKLAKGISGGGVLFNTAGTFGIPDLSSVSWYEVETVGADLTLGSIPFGDPTRNQPAFLSTAGGQFFCGVFVSIIFTTATPNLP